jgi:hypothetical protein
MQEELMVQDDLRLEIEPLEERIAPSCCCGGINIFSNNRDSFNVLSYNSVSL